MEGDERILEVEKNEVGEREGGERRAGGERRERKKEKGEEEAEAEEEEEEEEREEAETEVELARQAVNEGEGSGERRREEEEEEEPEEEEEEKGDDEEKEEVEEKGEGLMGSIVRSSGSSLLSIPFSFVERGEGGGGVPGGSVRVFFLVPGGVLGVKRPKMGLPANFFFDRGVTGWSEGTLCR